MAIVINSTTGEIDLNATTPGIYEVTYTTNGSCQNTVKNTITVNALDGATFAYSSNSLPQTGTASLTTTPTTSGGVYSAYPSGLSINSSTGEIDLANSTIQSYKVFYETSGAGCPNSSTFDLAVTASYLPFQMQFDTSGGKTITIPGTVGSSFTVDWGDGNTTTETGGTISHTYDSGRATSTVSIGAQGDTGAFTAFRNANQTSDDVENYLLDIPQWGDIQWSTMIKTFRKATNSSFDISATDTPDFSNLTTIQEMFSNAEMGNISTSGNLANWDVSNVTTLTYFAISSLNFNPDITGWNTQSVTNAYFPFSSPFNRNLSNWPLNASLTNFGAIFYLTSMSTENYTDSIVGWAVTVFKQSAPYNVSMTLQSGRTFDNSRTSDNVSGQTYAAKYGSDWTATGWTDAGDARDYLAGATAGWTISSDNRIN